MSSSSSSKTTCQLNERAQAQCQCLPLETSEMGDTHVYLMMAAAPTPRSQLSELQNLHRNSAAAAVCLSKKNLQRERNDIMVWLAWL